MRSEREQHRLTSRASRVSTFVAVLVAALVLVTMKPAAAEPRDDSMIVELHLRQVARELIEAPTLNGEPGVPVMSVLEWLEVNFEVFDIGRVMTGFMGSLSRPFEIRGTEAVVYRGERHLLGPDDAAWHFGELFLSARVWREILGVHFRYHPTRLTLVLHPDPGLPVYRRIQMQRARGHRPAWMDPEPADHHFEAREVRYGGHHLDWNIAAPDLASLSGIKGTSFGMAYGGDLFGGALRAATGGSVSEPTRGAHHLSWSRAFDLPALREARLGTVFSPGPAGRSLLGAVVTNAPVYPYQHYGDLDLALTLNPHSPIDAYLDGRYFDHHDAGPGGLYDTRIPLQYGHTRLQLRYLDEYGDLRTTEMLFRVPREMLREGEVRYYAATGVDRTEPKLGVTTIELGRGITRWVSLSGGGELLIGDEAHSPGIFPWARGLFRIDERTFLTLTGALKSHAGLSVDFASPSMVRVLASHREFSSHPILQPSTLRRETAFQASVPLQLGGFPTGFNVLAREAHHAAGQRSSIFRGSVLLRTPRAGHFVGGYQWRGDLFGAAHEQGLLLFRWSRALPREWLGGTVRLGLEVEPHEGHLSQLSAAWGRYLRGAGGLRVETAYLAGRPTGGGLRHNVTIGVRKHFDEAWLSTGLVAQSNTRPRLQARAGGSVSYSEEERALSFQRTPQVDRGRVVLRLQGQQVPAGSYHFLVDGKRHAVDENGEAVVSTLVRERVYRVRVESTPRADPLHSPRFEELDVRARANRTVMIDVPLDANFELEGALFTEPAAGVRRGLPGVRVRLTEKESGRERALRTFEDGFLYEFGIPPGIWRMAPDEGQLGRMGLVARPTFIEVAHGQADGVALHRELEFLAGTESEMTDEALTRRMLAALGSGASESAASIGRVLLRDMEPTERLHAFESCAHIETGALEEFLDAMETPWRLVVVRERGERACVGLAFGLKDAADPEASRRLENQLRDLIADYTAPIRTVSVEDLLEAGAR